MSGFEAAGIILAVLPLCISAIEDYNRGLEPLKAFMQWNNQLPTLIRALRAQHVHYEMNLKAILMPVTSEEEVSALMSDGYGEMWNGEIGKRLEDRLDLAYKSYQSTVEDCQRIMGSIAKGLDVDRGGKANRSDLQAILEANPPINNKYEFRKRVKFGLKVKDMKRLLKELDDNNKTLARFQEKTDTLAPYKKPNKNHFATIHRIRGHAKNLHDAIISRGRSCKSHKVHSLKLGLDKRIAATRAEAKKAFWKPPAIDFKVLFSADSPTIQELRIHILDDDPPKYQKLDFHHTYPGKAPKVLIQEPVNKPIKMAQMSFDYKALQVIDDVCAAAHVVQVDGHCHGLYLDGDGKLRGVFPVKQDIYHTSNDTVTLSELLSLPKKPGIFKKKLSRRERYILAVELTSSLLQLHSTPWLDEFWSKRDIYFFQSPSTGAAIVNQPYLSHTFDDGYPLASQMDPHAPKPTPNKIAHASPSLLALGIILLELYLNQSLESAFGRTEEDAFDVSRNGNEMLCAAWQWADSVGDEVSLPYWQAAQHCIKCMFEPMPRVASLHDAEFRQAVCEKVLVPLQEELWTFTEGPGAGGGGRHF
jgi:hypothetical protein